MSSLDEILPLFHNFCESVLKNEKKTAIEQYNALLKTNYIDENALDASKGFREALVDYIVKKKYKTELYKPTVFNYFLVFIRTLLDDSIEASKLNKLNANFESLTTFAYTNKDDREIQLLFVMLACCLATINTQQNNNQVELSRSFITEYSFLCIEAHKKDAVLMAAVCRLLHNYFPKEVKKAECDKLRAIFDELSEKDFGSDVVDTTLEAFLNEQLTKLIQLLKTDEPVHIDNAPLTELLEIHSERNDISQLANELVSSLNSWNEYVDYRTGVAGIDIFDGIVNWCMRTNNTKIFDHVKTIFNTLGDALREYAEDNSDFATSFWDTLLVKVFDYCDSNFKNERLFVPCTCILCVIFQNSIDRIDDTIVDRYRDSIKKWHEYYLENNSAEVFCNRLLLTFKKEIPTPNFSDCPIDLSDGKPWDFSSLDLSSC